MIHSSNRSTTGFEVIDYGESRNDLRSRTEVKFTLQWPDLGKLRKGLASACRLVSHNEQVSTVRSLYFDDASLSACRANLDGLGQRTKLRLRWYDSLVPNDRFFMEIKWRKNLVTGKHRYEIQSDTPLNDLSLREIYTRLLQVAPEKNLREVLRYTEPVIVVQYKREHFVSPDAALRLTLDYDLQFYDHMTKKRFAMRFPKKMDGFCVVEGKTPIGREQELKALLHPLTQRADRCSKYVHGCRMLGIVRAGE